MAEKIETEFYDAPSRAGYFGEYGGRFVAETLTHALNELSELYDRAQRDPNSRESFIMT